MATVDPIAIVGVLGAVGAVYNAYRNQKLNDQQQALKLKNEQIEDLRKMYEVEKAQNTALRVTVDKQEEDIKELRSLVMLERIPPALQKVLDEIIDMVRAVKKLVQTETGDIAHPSIRGVE